MSFTFQAFIFLSFKFQTFTFQVFTFQALFFFTLFYIFVSLFFLSIMCHKEKCLGIHLPYIPILRKFFFSKIFFQLFLKINFFFFKGFCFLKNVFFLSKVFKIKAFLHVSLSSKKESKVSKIFFFFKRKPNETLKNNSSLVFNIFL